MTNEKLIHNLIVDQLKERLQREYKEIKINPSGDPDLMLANHGMALANVEVETNDTITPERADVWKTMSQSGTKLILMVPKDKKAKVTDLLWQKGIMASISIGTYDITIHMP
jgi:hypothetical protein